MHSVAMLIGQVSELRQQQAARMNHGQEGMSSSPSESARFNLSPVGTAEQLDALTNALGDDTYRHQLVTYLCSFGGDIVVSFVDRVFGALFSEEITSFVTFYGQSTLLWNASATVGPASYWHGVAGEPPDDLQDAVTRAERYLRLCPEPPAPLHLYTHMIGMPTYGRGTRQPHLQFGKVDVLKTEVPPRQFDYLSSISLSIPHRPPRSEDSIRRNHGLLRCDVVIHIHPTKRDQRRRLEEAYGETQNALKIGHLMRLFEFCQQTFFAFAGETYEQIKGTPKGSPVSGLEAELVLQELEKIAFIQHEHVDDTFVIVKKDMLQHFHSLQQLPFLDVLVRRNLNGELETTVYRKATNTTQLLSFHINHPVAHKRSCVKTLFKQIQTHCSKRECAEAPDYLAFPTCSPYLNSRLV
ncbi:hypothetical protein SprV_0301345100 [Sparganum proliferum]